MSCTLPRLGLGLMGLVLTGCVSTPSPPLSPEIASAPAGDPTVSDTIAQAETHRGRRVRWGGRVLAISERSGAPSAQVQGRQLDQNAYPDPGSPPVGRFRVIGISPDTAQRLAVGEDITVAGSFVGLETEDDVLLPVIRSSVIHVWRAYPRYAYVDPPGDPYYYRRYYPPFYHLPPYGFHPYRYRYRHYHPFYGHRYPYYRHRLHRRHYGHPYRFPFRHRYRHPYSRGSRFHFGFGYHN